LHTQARMQEHTHHMHKFSVKRNHAPIPDFTISQTVNNLNASRHWTCFLSQRCRWAARMV